MRPTRSVRWMTACFSVVALAAAVAFERGDATGGPLTGRPVLNAPFSADATTTVRQPLPDGTTVERRGIRKVLPRSRWLCPS